jgi:hypothetical protein
MSKSTVVDPETGKRIPSDVRPQRRFTAWACALFEVLPGRPGACGWGRGRSRGKGRVGVGTPNRRPWSALPGRARHLRIRLRCATRLGARRLATARLGARGLAAPRRSASQSPGAHMSIAVWGTRHSAGQASKGMPPHGCPSPGQACRLQSAARPPPRQRPGRRPTRAPRPRRPGRACRCRGARPGCCSRARRRAERARARARRCARARAHSLAWASTRCCATSSSASRPSRTCPSSTARASRCRARPPPLAGMPATRGTVLTSDKLLKY